MIGSIFCVCKVLDKKAVKLNEWYVALVLSGAIICTLYSFLYSIILKKDYKRKHSLVLEIILDFFVLLTCSSMMCSVLLVMRKPEPLDEPELDVSLVVSDVDPSEISSNLVSL